MAGSKLKLKLIKTKSEQISKSSDYNNEDVFVHSSAIIKNNPNKYKPSLNEGEPVEFDILKSIFNTFVFSSFE